MSEASELKNKLEEFWGKYASRKFNTKTEQDLEDALELAADIIRDQDYIIHHCTNALDRLAKALLK